MKAFNTENLWNRLVNVMNTHKQQDKRKHAAMLLRQMNTAAGQTLLKMEAANFLQEAEN